MTRFSMLDLATSAPGRTVREALAEVVPAARAAEAAGYHRVWYAEHHNMQAVASSATAVLVGHVAAHTSSIRLGAGGVMLPNHSPLAIAEQFGTLAELHPGRIDLGLGRAPGGDLAMLAALRRRPEDSERFPTDVVELASYLGDGLPTEAVNAYPGRGTKVPLYILGSSLFGANLAARLGLPYAFASHFAPDALDVALATYRRSFRPSAACPEPYAIVAANVVASDDAAEAAHTFRAVLRERVRRFVLRPGAELSDVDVETILDGSHGERVRHMMSVSAVGKVADVRGYVGELLERTGADEIIVAHQVPELRARVRSIELLAEALA
ncbi:LLM class flavin-dependent oxidoreductase [Sanguibacter sp. HDW7]|uniref:LLM class flavin-dependent oxidoreductase n=1 Tax=Sanguibacter sp. HDW7 TaxID=2714931 RepID=UPI00140AC2DA|nr:LLM class flavin-dependent oxidoreductase [Sanguibacter sp. HDW7]QIK83753.1 LLM class flavin-dependent oxidoreductase [Sanguibacter sp. HDW7]